MTKHTIAVEHVRIESAQSFADVRTALERIVPHVDPSLVKALDEGDTERVAPPLTDLLRRCSKNW